MIHLTPAAVQELQRLSHHQSDAPFLQIRLEVQPGCCADWTYSFTPNSKTEAGDIQVSHDGFEITVNQAHLSLLEGVTIDYSEDLLGGAFRYQNPNAASTCDCGHSFSTTPQETEHNP